MAYDKVTIDKRRIQDDEGTGMDFDDATGAISSIDYGHHEVHEGNAYCVHAYSVDLDTAATITIAFTTPDTTKWLHVVPLVHNSVSSHFDILEAPTLTADSGSELYITQRNRNSANESGVLSIETTQQANVATLDPTITDGGTTIQAEALGGPKQYGGTGLRDTTEYILKQDTTYAFRLTGDADNGVASVRLVWYEHTNLA